VGVIGSLTQPPKASPKTNQEPVEKETRPPAREAKPAPRKPAVEPQREPPPPRLKVRTGRMPGRQDKPRVPKEKATVYISAEVMGEYREWTWECRCYLGELIEQAMRDYYRRQRKKSSIT
jgi:hypothetical protein